MIIYMYTAESLNGLLIDAGNELHFNDKSAEKYLAVLKKIYEPSFKVDLLIFEV